MDASGKTTELAGPGTYDSPRFSPDGKRLAYIASSAGGADVWIIDLERKTAVQLTFNSPGDYELVWAPDGKHLVFSSGSTMWWVRADGSAPPVTLLRAEGDTLRPQSFAPDGRRLAFVRHDLPDIWTLPVDLSDVDHPRPGNPEPFLNDPNIVEVDAAFSPDGRFMAYDSDGSGSEEVYVRSFPGPGGRWKISTAGGKFQPGRTEAVVERGDPAKWSPPEFRFGAGRKAYRHVPGTGASGPGASAGNFHFQLFQLFAAACATREVNQPSTWTHRRH